MRDLFSELVEGFEALEQCRLGTCSHANRPDPLHWEKVAALFMNDAGAEGVMACSGPVIYWYGYRLPRKLKKKARMGVVLRKERKAE